MAKKQIRQSLYRIRRRIHLMSWRRKRSDGADINTCKVQPKAKSPEHSCHFIPTILCKIPANNHCRSLETRHVLLQVSRLLRYQIFMILHGLIIYTYIYCIYIYIHHHIYTCIHGFMPPNPHVSICFCTACHLNHKSNLVPVDYFFPVQVACHSMP